jgi:hypothetical protein
MDFGLESEFTNYLILFIYIFKINTIQKYPNLPTKFSGCLLNFRCRSLQQVLERERWQVQ